MNKLNRERVLRAKALIEEAAKLLDGVREDQQDKPVRSEAIHDQIMDLEEAADLLTNAATSLTKRGTSFRKASEA
jgi:uncharacterized membrane protein